MDTPPHTSPTGDMDAPPDDRPRLAEHRLHQSIEAFVNSVEGAWTTVPLLVLLLEGLSRQHGRAFATFLAEKAIDRRQEGNTTHYVLPLDHFREHERLRRQRDAHRLAFTRTPQSHIVALVSEYDYFLGQLLSWVFDRTPELLNDSERKLSYSQLATFSSIQDARRFMLEKEVETFLRKSHVEQFAWLERKLDVTLRSGLPAWSDFVELTERRNLFVHTGGVVSSQYIEVCSSNKVSLPGQCTLGTYLGVDQPYFEKACAIISEVGVKLAHVIWRKLAKEERHLADMSLNDIAYESLAASRYALARTFLDFSLNTLKSHSTEKLKRTFAINLAQAYKWEGKEAECLRVLNGLDWTATTDIFRLALAVLKDDFDEAGRLMRAIGVKSEPSKGDYRAWPLFKEFRQSKQFRDAYQTIFSEPFVLSETVDAPEQPESAVEVSAPAPNPIVMPSAPMVSPPPPRAPAGLALSRRERRRQLRSRGRR